MLSGRACELGRIQSLLFYPDPPKARLCAMYMACSMVVRSPHEDHRCPVSWGQAQHQSRSKTLSGSDQEPKSLLQPSSTAAQSMPLCHCTCCYVLQMLRSSGEKPGRIAAWQVVTSTRQSNMCVLRRVVLCMCIMVQTKEISLTRPPWHSVL